MATSILEFIKNFETHRKTIICTSIFTQIYIIKYYQDITRWATYCNIHFRLDRAIRVFSEYYVKQFLRRRQIKTKRSALCFAMNDPLPWELARCCKNRQKEVLDHT